MEQRMRDWLESTFRKYGVTHKKEEKINRIVNYCMMNLEDYPDIKKRIQDSNSFNHYMMQTLLSLVFEV